MILLWFMPFATYCDDLVPMWVMVGIAKVETRSYWDDNGEFHYVDRRTGLAGEIGAFQVTPDCFKTYAHHGESFHRLRYDTEYAILFTLRILMDLHRKTGSWDRTLKRYNGAWSYVAAVKVAGGYYDN